MKRTQRVTGLFLCVLASGAVMLCAAAAYAAPSSLSRSPEKQVTMKSVSSVQVPFVKNEGQIGDEGVRYYTRTFGGNFYVRENGEMVYLLSSRPETKDKKGLRMPGSSGEVKTTFIKEMLVDAKKTSVEAKDPAATKVNYFIGNDRGKWKTNLPTYGSVSLGEVYGGITLSLKAYGKRVEKVFTVQPGADPGAIRLKMEGASSLKVNEQGELEVETGLGMVRFSKPVAYQERDGARTDVRVAYVADGNKYGFKAHDYDGTLPLVIDPALSYGTYLGGSGDEEAFGIAVDASGNAYVAGGTNSTDFPTVNAYQSTKGAFFDAFVAKIDPSQTGAASLVYCTYLGGNYGEEGWGIAVDGYGNVYVTGYTESTDFPTLNPYQATLRGLQDAFVTKLDPSGIALYSTYLGGMGMATEYGAGIAVDASGNAYVGGRTDSSSFPILYPLPGQGIFPGGAGAVAFVTKIDPSQSGANSLVYSTYLGGNFDTFGYAIAVDGSGNAYVTGQTSSSNFPTLNAYQAALNGTAGFTTDAFVTKLAWDGTNLKLSLVYSTYLGGNDGESANGIAVDGSGKAYVTGFTRSTNFPVSTSAYQGSNAGQQDAFVTKIDPSQTGTASLLYSTYLGGTSGEWPQGIAIDGSGNAYVTGETYSADFPVLNALQDALKGAHDAFVTKLNSSGTALVYSTYLGGTDGEVGQGIAVDGSGDAYVTGGTRSSDFPTRLDSYQPDFKGLSDAFIVKLTEALAPDHLPPAFTLITPTDGQVNVTSPLTIQVQITDPSGVYFNAPGCSSSPPNCYTDPWSIVLRLGNFLVNPISWDGTTLTYDDSGIGMAQPGQCYTATVEAHDLLKNPGSVSIAFKMADPSNPDPPFGPTDEVYPCTYPVFGSRQVCLKDTDLDGIPDDGKTMTDGTPAPVNQQRLRGNEASLYTTSTNYLTPPLDSAKRTLFIRPFKQIGLQKVPWQEFIDMHLPYVKVPFEKRGIELRVIDPGFDPYQLTYPDGSKPPVSIVEITYDMDTVADAITSTYFSSLAKTWFWGLMGETPYETTPCSNKTKYGYFKTTVYANSIKRYLCDRQYPDLTVQTPMLPPEYACTSTTLKSPMNFGNDGTVEFNPFTFAMSGMIQTAPEGPAAPYTENQVIQRVIAHEIGHTLLNASVGDHCSNENCIMYGSLSSATGWAVTGFGAGTGGNACTHSPGKTYDIKPRVLNKLNPTYVPTNCPGQ